MDTHMRLKVFGNGDVTITIPHAEINDQIEVLKALVATNTPNLKAVDDILNALTILRIMKK